MRVLILGIDGYIGWPLAQRLLADGYEVAGLDNGSRRLRVTNMNANSLIPILPIVARQQNLVEYHGKNFIEWRVGGVHSSIAFMKDVLNKTRPDAIVHLAEQPSAPWSMKSANNAMITQKENVLGTLNLLWAMKEVCPDAHLLKLGTMGEYGVPACDIPEGIVPAHCLDGSSYSCPMAGLLFPRSPGSFYHLSKVHDTYNVVFACNTWGLRATDVMQGIVFGIEGGTRFDYDQCFGTVLNRFCAQVIAGYPLTVYGSGEQTRGFLPLKESLECLMLALENPPARGEYRTFNQFGTVWPIARLVKIVLEQAEQRGFSGVAHNIPNPRVESEQHYYQPECNGLIKLGYSPTPDIVGEIGGLMEQLAPYRHQVRRSVIASTINWQ